ncbi:hypothetical protein [Haloarchaeobius sp. TZWWS8]|uniref:hypothetical protein n=1 Tax=Haloarchaeobius sp. TZWWS8 TaxID=3446121 RepID=UPI003EC068D5
MRHALPTLLCCLLLMTAGCVSDPLVPGANPTDTESKADDPVEPSEASPGTTVSRDLGEPTTCGVSSVAFWKPPNGWESDEVQIGYTIDGNSTVLFVVLDGNEVVGVKESTNSNDQALAVDGEPIRIDPETGGRVSVVAFSDENGNLAFDPGTDRPCGHDGEVVSTGERSLN